MNLQHSGYFLLQIQHNLLIEIRQQVPTRLNSSIFTRDQTELLILPNGITLSDVRIYDLFKKSTHIGRAFYIYKKSHWDLCNIKVIANEAGNGYGSFLLDKSCDLVWKLEKIDIKLCSSKDEPDNKGFNRYQWYLRHGFKGKPLSWMTKEPM